MNKFYSCGKKEVQNSKNGENRDKNFNMCIYIFIAILIFEHGKEGMEFQILSRVSNSIEFLF